LVQLDEVLLDASSILSVGLEREVLLEGLAGLRRLPGLVRETSISHVKNLAPVPHRL